jgi:hypothetical protein
VAFNYQQEGELVLQYTPAKGLVGSWLTSDLYLGDLLTIPEIDQHHGLATNIVAFTNNLTC